MPIKLGVLALALLQMAVSAYAAPFRAAVVKVDITPATSQWLLGYDARQSDGIHDRIYHRIAVLDDGNQTVVLISTDMCLISPEYAERVEEQIHRQLGIDPKNIWWMATHTHSAPEIGPTGIYAVYMPERAKQAKSSESNPEYSRLVEQKLIEGIRQAQQQLQPARIGFGIGFANANINRRAVNEDGSVSLGLNPDRPTDRQIGVIRLETLGGKLIGLLANYSIHGTVLGPPNLKISGDAPGIVAQYIEEKLGAPMLFINGAEGDMAPIYTVYPDFESGHLSEFRVLLGDRILDANRRIAEMTSDVTLHSGERFIVSPMREGRVMPPGFEQYVRPSQGKTPLARVPVRYIEINRDVVLWGAPLEMFCQISMDVRNHSPFPYTFYFGLMNGWFGYLPTGAAIREGGYEPSVSLFTDQGEEDFRRGVNAMLDELPR